MTVSELQSEFETAYRALYGRVIPGMAIEVLSWSLRIAAPPPRIEKTGEAKQRYAVRAPRMRDVFDAGSAKRLSYGVHERTALAPGAQISGPALIVEAQTTTVVTASFDAVIDNARNIVLTRKARA